MQFNNQIKTSDSGMCDSETYYEIEDLYQAFKERMIKELAVSSPDMRTLGVLINKQE